MAAHVDAKYVPGHRGGGRGSSTTYVVTGSKADVEAEVASIRHAWPPGGYGTRFDPPKEEVSGTWVSRGWRDNSCD